MNRRNKIKVVLTFAVMAIAMVAVTTSAGAAELTEILVDTIYSQNTIGASDQFPISVYPGNTSYSGKGEDGEVSGDFDGSPGYMFGFRFFNDVAGLTTVAQSDPNLGGYGLIGPAIASEVAGNDNWGTVWTTSDPDVNEADFMPIMFAKTNSVTGTINISRLSSGVVYFIYGGYRTDISVDLTMTGAGQTDLTIVKGGHEWCNNNEVVVSGFEFTDADDYETISYTYVATNGKFLGVVIDGMDKYAPTMTMVDKAAWSGEPVPMSLNVVSNDPNQNPLEFAWSYESVEGVTVDISDPAIEAPTVTITKDANTGDVTTVTLTLAANNVGSGPAMETLTIDVYDDACEMAKVLNPVNTDMPTDFNKNCVTGLDDLAIMVAAWLDDYTATEAVVKQ